MSRGGRATRTSDGPGGGNCWPRKSGPLYTPGSASEKDEHPRNAYSIWPHDIQAVTERTVERKTSKIVLVQILAVDDDRIVDRDQFLGGLLAVVERRRHQPVGDVFGF